jgi:hypothetical protein
MADSSPPVASSAPELSPWVVAFGWGLLGIVLGGFLDMARQGEQVWDSAGQLADAGMWAVRWVTFLGAILVGFLLVLQVVVSRDPTARRVAGGALLVGTVLFLGCLAAFVVSSMALWANVVGPWGKALLFVLFGQVIANAWVAVQWYRAAP